MTDNWITGKENALLKKRELLCDSPSTMNMSVYLFMRNELQDESVIAGSHMSLYRHVHAAVWELLHE